METYTGSKASGTGILPLVSGGESNLALLRRKASKQTTDELKADLARLLGFTAENLLLLAVVVAELESRGEDLSGLRIGLLPILRQIAAGQLLPEIVVLFAGQPSVIKRIAAMPRERQERIARREEELPELSRPTRAEREEDSEELLRSGICAGRSAGQPKLKEMAQHGTPRDVGEMAANLIMECEDPQAALAEFVRQIQGALPKSGPMLRGLTA